VRDEALLRRVRARIKAEGLRQGTIANECGLSQPVLSFYLNDKYHLHHIIIMTRTLDRLRFTYVFENRSA
jgi:predicted transcriptional regulator